MGDLVKTVLGGGWSLVVGWLVPSTVNVLVFALVVLPSLDTIPPLAEIGAAGATQQSLALLGIAVLVGLVFSALQTPLYRVLEGYLGWPRWAFDWGRRRQRRAKYRLELRILLDREDSLDERDRERLATLRAWLGERGWLPGTDRWAPGDLSAIQRALCQDRLDRYPPDDRQIAPTRLGNGIRRLEVYARNRYNMDSQTLWYELVAAAPEQVVRDESQSRTSLDFLVCLLYGHILVAAAGFVALLAGPPRPATLAIATPALIALAFLWYRLAVGLTDDWASVVRALVNLGRQPLAERLGLQLPTTHEDERDMWRLVSRLAADPYRGKGDLDELDRYRAKPPAPGGPGEGSAPG